MIEVVNENCAVNAEMYRILGSFYPNDPEVLDKLWYEGKECVVINAEVLSIAL